jgi:hypothetical protein
MESPLPFDQEEEYVADWFIVMLYGLYPKKDEPLEEVKPLNSMANFDAAFISHGLDEDHLGEMPDSNNE